MKEAEKIAKIKYNVGGAVLKIELTKYQQYWDVRSLLKYEDLFKSQML